MERIRVFLHHILQGTGVGMVHQGWLTQTIILLGIFIISYLATQLFRRLVVPAVRRITARTKATWDDYLFNDEMLHAFGRLIPPIVWYVLLPFAFPEEVQLLHFLLKACLIYLIVVTLLLLNSFLKSVYEISNEHESLRNRPLKGIYQMINILAIGVGIILIISILIDKDATTILAGLGASAAVLMLVFKDSILGLVAGVQLSANDMLRPGDWITMPKYGADGDVIEVTLTTVKVRNFDKTITTIPPYALVSDSFQNWRGMRETGGRRIKRSINIDLNTIHFCTDEEKQRFIARGWLDAESAQQEIVNLYVFQTYLQHYLTIHPKTHKELMIMVRQMQPTSEGVPLEIYCFSNTSVWPMYEQIQAEIFDHVFAIIPEFGLRIFQSPSGIDIKSIQTKASN